MTSSYDAALVDTAMIESEAMLSLDYEVRWLWLEALVWSKQHRSDGRIPAGRLRRLTDLGDPEVAATALVEAGLWLMTADGWQIVDYADTQLTKARVERKIAIAKDARDRYEDRHPGRSHRKGDVSPEESPDASASLPASPPAKGVGRQVNGGGAAGPVEPAAAALEEVPPLSPVPDIASPSRREMARFVRDADSWPYRRVQLDLFHRTWGHLYPEHEHRPTRTLPKVMATIVRGWPVWSIAA
jgi:hypothetical protein